MTHSVLYELKKLVEEKWPACGHFVCLYLTAILHSHPASREMEPERQSHVIAVGSVPFLAVAQCLGWSRGLDKYL